jgi:hypothetical protein
MAIEAAALPHRHDLRFRSRMVDISSYVIRIIVLCQLGAFIYVLTSRDWRLGWHSYVTVGIMFSIDVLVSAIFTRLIVSKKANEIIGEIAGFAATLCAWSIYVGKTPTLFESLWAAQYLVYKAAVAKMAIDRLD